MRTPVQYICVVGMNYKVTERAGLLRAEINGHCGWTSVWADTLQKLQRRVEQVIRSGGQ